MKLILTGIIICSWILMGCVFIFLIFAPNTEEETSIGTKKSFTDLNVFENEIDEVVQIDEDNYLDTNMLHWKKIPITYKIENKDKCNIKVKERIELALKKIQNETEYLISFDEVNEDPGISFYCEPYLYEEVRNWEGEGYGSVTNGDAMIESYDINNAITKASIRFYGMGSICLTGYPATEVHEILHVLGFDHNYGLNDIMQPYAAETSSDCKTNKIDEKYISCLKYIYSDGTIKGDCTNINMQ